MYKIGDRVKFIKLNFTDKAIGLSLDEVYEIGVEEIFDDGTSCIRLNNGEKHWVQKNQLKKVEESKEMTFPEMVQKLIDGDFEVGTELVRDDGVSSYFVDNIPYDNKYGLTRNLDSISVLATVGAIDLNANWTVKEQPIKEMSIEELQKELGYKIKIVERESK